MAATPMPQNVRVRIDVGGSTFHTSLHTLLEGARRGSPVFRSLVAQVLGPGEMAAAGSDRPRTDGLSWEQRIVPGEQGPEIFLDADPLPFPVWLEYLRSGEVPFVEAGPLRERVIRDTQRAGLAELAEGLRSKQTNKIRLQVGDHVFTTSQETLSRVEGSMLQVMFSGRHAVKTEEDGSVFIDRDGQHFQLILNYLRDGKLPSMDRDVREALSAEAQFYQLDDLVRDLKFHDYSRSELQTLLLKLGNVNLHGAVLRGQELSRLGFAGCCLRLADLSGCNLQDCSFKGAEITGADLQGADLTHADLNEADLRGAKLEGATLPLWDSGRMEGAKLRGARGWVPAGKNLREAKLAGADLSGCELSGVDMTDADMTKTNLSAADLTGADLTNTKLSGAQLSGAKLDGARGGRGHRVAVQGPHGSANFNGTLKVGRPLVVALTAARALRLDRVFVKNLYKNDASRETNKRMYSKNMEVLSGPSAKGPWTSVLAFTGRETADEQTFAAPAGTPLIIGFVQVVVHDTYGAEAYVESITLEGEAWGPAA